VGRRERLLFAGGGLGLLAVLALVLGGLALLRPIRAAASGKAEISAPPVSGAAEREAPEGQKDDAPEGWEQRVALVQDRFRPGEPITAVLSGEGVRGEDNIRALLFDAGGKRLGAAPFFVFDGEGEERLWAALLAIPSTARPGPASLRVEAGGALLGTIGFTIEDRKFAAEEIPLDSNNTDIRTRPDPQKTREAEILWALLSRSGEELYTLGPFMFPVRSTRRTSRFGDRRVYLYADGTRGASIHAGVDYGVPKGTKVYSCAAGKVVLAGPRIVTGNSVVLEHLPGLYSLYYHLDRIEVKEGDLVEAGSLLGYSGATGLATGPHLHWEVRAAGENVDPDSFTAAPILDKTVVLDKLRYSGLRYEGVPVKEPTEVW
jgi:murein DD-endopeptidase MepM/ murein hydrolase activator NlpD